MKKKLLLSVLIILASTFGAIAQQKGDISLNANFSLSSLKSTNTVGDNESDAGDISKFAITAGARYFVADNLAVGLSLGYDYSKTLIDLGAYKTQANFNVVPSLTYYKKIVDKLYYTPSLSFVYSTGKIDNPDSPTNTEVDLKLEGYGVTLHFLSLEYKLTERLGISLSLGSMRYNNYGHEYQDTSLKNKEFNLNLSMNNFSYGINFYF